MNGTGTVTPIHVNDRGQVTVDLRPMFEQSARQATARFWAQVPTFTRQAA